MIQVFLRPVESIDPGNTILVPREFTNQVIPGPATVSTIFDLVADKYPAQEGEEVTELAIFFQRDGDACIPAGDNVLLLIETKEG